MEINRLRSDELTWELTVRGCEVGSTVEQKRAQLREAFRNHIPDNPSVHLDSASELSICSAKLDELVGQIQEFDKNNRLNEFNRINSRLIHIQGRLNRLKPTSRALEQKKENLTFLLSGVLGALQDANHIASLGQSNRAESSYNPVNSNMNQFEGSLLDSPIVSNLQNVQTLSPISSSTNPNPPVGMLIDLRNNNQVNGSGVNQNNDGNNRAASNVSTCMELARRLNEISLQPIVNQPAPAQHLFSSIQMPYQNLSEPVRRVSFASDEITGNTKPVIEGMYSTSCADYSKGLQSDCEHHVNKNDRGSCSYNNNFLCNVSKPSVPIYKWNVTYDGSGSVISFLEDIEHLAESRNISRAQLFKSIYEILRGDARDWYLPRKTSFVNWENFKERLKEAFLPLNYEENLLEDIKKRTQGSDEKLILYVTRMQNLFKKLVVKRPTEQEQVNIIRRNLLPHLQTALTFQDTKNIEELFDKGKEVEQTQWQAQQYCPPPRQSRLVQEPHLSYRQHNRNGHIPIRAIESQNMETSTPPQLIENTQASSSSALNSQRNENVQLTRNKPLVCWNCNQSGHTIRHCSQPLKLACFRCGRVGYTTRTCPTCSKNGRQGN